MERERKRRKKKKQRNRERGSGGRSFKDLRTSSVNYLNAIFYLVLKPFCALFSSVQNSSSKKPQSKERERERKQEVTVDHRF